MAPLPVITNVFRVVMPWVGGSVSPVNVFHVRTAGSETASAVGDAIDGALLGLSEDPWQALKDTYSCPVIRITKLDGSSAETDRALDHVPQGGQSGDELLNCCAVVSFKTLQRGSRGRGRMYVGPTTESSTDGGLLDNTVKTQMNTGWVDFLNNLGTQDPVLSFVIASYTHADAHDVDNFHVDSVIGTQRRRLDQIRS